MALIVMIPLMLPLIENIGLMILQAKNKHSFRSKVYMIIAVMNIFLTIPLAKVYGGIGCATATAISLLLGNCIIVNIYYHKVIKIDIINFFKELKKLFILSLLAFVIGYLLINIIEILISINFIICIIIYSVLFYMLIWCGFNNYEKSIFKNIRDKIIKNLVRK